LIDLVPYIVVGLLIVAVPLTLAAAVVKHRRDRAAEKAPPKVAEVAPVTSAPPAPDGPRCPCGAPATRPLPRARVWEVPLLGRLITRQRDAFGEAVVCDAHADVADTVIDERIAEARLADARAQRDRFTALANAVDVVAAVATTLPEAQRRQWERRRAQCNPVREQRQVTGKDGDEGA
jgi:hypothetical protein